jgi:hypothetical protein
MYLPSKTQLGKWLSQLYPQMDWSKLYLLKGRYSQQRHLERVVSAIFEVGETSIFFFSLSPLFCG